MTKEERDSYKNVAGNPSNFYACSLRIQADIAHQLTRIADVFEEVIFRDGHGSHIMTKKVPNG